jgi:hypothetical protein
MAASDCFRRACHERFEMEQATSAVGGKACLVRSFGQVPAYRAKAWLAPQLIDWGASLVQLGEARIQVRPISAAPMLMDGRRQTWNRPAMRFGR